MVELRTVRAYCTQPGKRDGKNQDTERQGVSGLRVARPTPVKWRNAKRFR
jgi:hypothetical protein